MAEYAVFMYKTDERSAPEDAAARAAALAEHDAYAREMADAGEMVFARPLRAPAQSRSLRPDGVTDGPYLEAAESVVGFYVVEAADLEAALAIARRNPILHQGGGVEVRPVG